jgi:TetR/AcrR family transcriptional regulator, transcriptional repressor for nem operon
MAKSPEETKRVLLEVAFQEIHLHGFQATSITNILENTELSKGALYHHFKNKTELGYAVVDEVLKPMFVEAWIIPLEKSSDVVSTIIEIINQHREQACSEMLSRGCPLNNLVAEMSPIDEGFRIRLEAILTLWKNKLSEAFQKSIEKGLLKENLDPVSISEFIIAIIEGVSSLSKNSQSTTVIDSCMHEMIYYLESLRKI